MDDDEVVDGQLQQRGGAELDAARLAAELDELEALSRFDRDRALMTGRAAAAATTARRLGAAELERRADLVSADVRRRDGHLAEAGRAAQDALQWATEHDARHLLARSHFLLAAVFQELGDLAVSLEHAVLAADVLADDAPPRLRLDHRMRVADSLGLGGDAAALDRYTDVLATAERLGDVPRLLLVLNNGAHIASLVGAHETALAWSGRLQELAAAHGSRLDVGNLDTVARVLIGVGRLAEAEAALRPGLAPEVLDRSPDGDAGADFLLTHAEVQHSRGHHAEAQASLDECVRRCETHGLTAIRVRARREQAELHAAGGNYRAAYEEHVRYTGELQQLQSEQRDARARALHALYETTEARRQSRRYRELSVRDPLTGLYNRRHLDDQLPSLLLRGQVLDQPIAVALLDLDHFKRINDTCSHEVGDEVLRRVAAVLESTAAELSDGSFAVRMGGEEFLLVLVGSSAAEAVRVLEQVRGAVAAQHWHELTGTLPVTVSIGVASSPDPERLDPAELLSRADARLYRAKGNGRDRVVGPGHGRDRVVGPGTAPVPRTG